MIGGKVKVRNLKSYYTEIGQVLLYVYKNTNLGAMEKQLRRMVKYLGKLLPWLKAQESSADSKVVDTCSNLAGMVSNVKTKLNNFRFEQLYSKGLTQKNANNYKIAKACIIEQLCKKKKPRVAPSKQLIKACLKPKILSFNDLGDVADDKPFRHEFKLSWTRVPLDSPTSAENSTHGVAGPYDFYDSHKMEVDAQGPFNEKL